MGRQFTENDSRGELSFLNILKNLDAKIIFVVTHVQDDNWDQERVIIDFLKENNFKDLLINIRKEIDKTKKIKTFKTIRNIVKVDLGKKILGLKEVFNQIIYLLNNKSSYNSIFN